MTWGMVAVGAGTAIAGVVGANKASKSASRAAAQQQAAMQQDLAFRKQIYEDEKAFRDPIRNYLKGLALAPGSLDYDINKAMIERQVGDARRGIDQELAAGGMEGTGLGVSRRLGLGLGRAKALSQAWASGVARKRELAAALLGKADVNGAANGVSQATGAMAGAYGDQARRAAAAEAAGWSAAGQGLGAALSAWGKRGIAPPQGTVTPAGVTETIPVSGAGTQADTMNGLGFDWTQPGMTQNVPGETSAEWDSYGGGW